MRCVYDFQNSHKWRRQRWCNTLHSLGSSIRVCRFPCKCICSAVCFTCISMQACVAIREDMRLDGDKYLVPCERHCSLLLMDGSLSGFTGMRWRGRITKVKGPKPWGLVKGVKQNQALIFLDGLCFFAVIDWYCPAHWESQEKARSVLTLLPITAEQNVRMSTSAVGSLGLDGGRGWFLLWTE